MSIPLNCLMAIIVGTVSVQAAENNTLKPASRETAAVKKQESAARKQAWLPYAAVSQSPVLQAWLASVGETPPGRSPRTPVGSNTTSAFAMLGGRAAVEETLQMQLLVPGASSPDAGEIPIDAIPGVEVKAHPFEKMLAGSPGKTLPLAYAAPLDRFFVYAAQPSALLPFLDKGAGFISRLGTGLTGNAFQYNLTPRYLKRLGLDENWLRTFLESDAVSELFMTSPDLFFIDGTDLTVVSRLRQPRLLAGFLNMIGVRGLSNTEMFTLTPANGDTVFWALRDDLLFLSTSQEEMAAHLELWKKEGEGSLGKSSEFRYMLTQLPLGENTRMMAYFSDPFIRRLVGPKVKISQLRRMKARADMERIVAAALLARMDGVLSPDLLKLVEMGYLPERFQDGGYSIDDHLQVRSNVYGPLPQMWAVQKQPFSANFFCREIGPA